jgi:hypothetical protein
METQTKIPTAKDYEKASKIIQSPQRIAKLTRQLGEAVLGRGTIDDIAYLIAAGTITVLEA